MSVGDTIRVVADIGHAAEMTEPNAKLVLGAANVVVVTRDGAKGEREMMRHDKDKVANGHVVREREIVALTAADRLWVCQHEVAWFACEVEANEICRKTTRCVLGCSRRVIRVKLHPPVSHSRALLNERGSA